LIDRVRGAMVFSMRSWLVSFVLLMLAVAGPASAGKREIDDLKRQIDSQRASVGDLERLDDRRAVTEEISILRSWIDEAATKLQKDQLDKAREALDRCVAQTELIRQKMTAQKASAQAAEKEAELKRSRERVEKTKIAIQQATLNKKALEMNTK
jgi:hypothetical protein